MQTVNTNLNFSSRQSSAEKENVGSLPLTREQIITECGIPAEIFDYVDKALKDPDTIQKAVSYWLTSGRKTACEIRLDQNHSLFFFMEGPDGSEKGQIGIIGTCEKNAWKEPVFQGPLTPKAAQVAIATVRDLAG